MVLNAAIELWCQYSILRKTASISLVTEKFPSVVSEIKIVLGIIL